MRKIILVASLLLIPTVLSACIHMLNTGESAQKSGEFAKGKVVRGFGANVPLYKRAQIIETFASKSSYGGSFITEDDLSKVLKYYQDVLPKLGWESQISEAFLRISEIGQNNYVFEIKNQESRGEIIVNVAGDGKKTAITIAVSER